ncbi:Phage head-tail joining protein [[Clostridium] sordellii]|uniref:phage head completion protein n=1 Tax=Paraclostridium sordellii TaxID=1505 RepID=UPI00054442A8|nr:head-tail adaptor protein [Paeniclostridium sordellii]CEK33581.1 Phage head-tail joining protein [[Clostridium] sordellii] [Paeniclostridium sordellii]
MELSKFREKIEIQELKEILDEGYSTKEYITKYILRAKKKTVLTKEYMLNNSSFTSLTLKFVIRKRNIDSNNYVFYKNDRYDIKHVHEFEDGRYIELTVEKVS